MIVTRLLVLLFTLSLASATGAQTPTAPMNTVRSPAAKPYTPADALASHVPQDGQVLAVGWTRLPPDVSPPKPDASLNTIAAAFGLIARRFGSVTAFAPPMMTLINANPKNPDLFQDLSSGDKFKIFAASLSQTQWQALTGDRGLGMSDLTDDRQRAMFAALFPKQLSVQPRLIPGQDAGPEQSQDVTADLPLARLRFGQRLNIMVPANNHSFVGLRDFYKPNGPPEYVTTSTPVPEDKSTTFGVPVRDEVPNVLKATPLDWNAKPLLIPIPLTGVKTVGDLVQRIGGATHLELYADARWEKTPVTISGATAAAKNLLQALALCLTGTYRPVGSAFVLTADQVGDGTREQIWDEFAEEVRLGRMEPINQATSKIGAAHSPHDLSWYGDPLAFSPQQAQNVDPRYPSVELPFSQLTPAQQAAVRGLAAQMQSETIQNAGSGDPLRIDMTFGKMRLEAHPEVQVIVPSLSAPVTMEDTSRHLYAIGQVFEPSMAEQMAQMRQTLAKRKPKAAIPLDLAAFTARFAAVPHRAVMAQPHTAAAVDALVASMKIIGLNQLWLTVFSNGVSAVPGTNDILSEALSATKGTGIQVFPVLNLLSWGQTTPVEDRDRTLRGEDTLQDDARLEKRDAAILAAVKQYADAGLGTFDPPMTDFGSVRVSPLTPNVTQKLAALVKTLVSRPGVAGLVWQDTVSPGYDVSSGYQPDNVGDVAYRTPLGYTDAARLAFLRQTHADPLDVSPTQYVSPDPDVTLFVNDGQSQNLRAQWNRLRSQADIQFLQTLFQAAQTPNGSKPLILIRQRRDINTDSTGTPIWFGSWDKPKSPLPAFHSAGEDTPQGTPWPEQLDAMTQAKTQSQVAMVRLAPRVLPTVAWLDGQLKKLPQGKSWDGFVLDLTPRIVFGTSIGISPAETNPLKHLADDMTPAKSTP